MKQSKEVEKLDKDEVSSLDSEFSYDDSNYPCANKNPRELLCKMSDAYSNLLSIHDDWKRNYYLTVKENSCVEYDEVF